MWLRKSSLLVAVFRIRYHWVRIQIFCWIRIWIKTVAESGFPIQSESGTTQIFIMKNCEKLLKILQLENYFDQKLSYMSSSTVKGRSGSSNLKFLQIFLFWRTTLTSLDPNFTIRVWIRIRWPNWIRTWPGSKPPRNTDWFWSGLRCTPSRPLGAYRRLWGTVALCSCTVL